MDNAFYDDILHIMPGVDIPRTELQFRTSRSGGPGGQHVNKVETRVELLFDVAASPSLAEETRQRLRETLAARLGEDGVLRIVAHRYGSQLRNREDAVARFVTLLQHALQPRKLRRPTRIPRAVNETRLEGKKQRSVIKRLRGRGRGDE